MDKTTELCIFFYDSNLLLDHHMATRKAFEDLVCLLPKTFDADDYFLIKTIRGD